MSWNKEHQQCIICLSSFSWWMWNHAQPPSFSMLEMLLGCSVSLQIMNVLQWLVFPRRFKSHLNHVFSNFFLCWCDVVGIRHSSGDSIFYSIALLFRLNLHITMCMFWYWRNRALRIWLDLNFSRSWASVAGKLWQINQLKHCWTQVRIISKTGDVCQVGSPLLFKMGSCIACHLGRVRWKRFWWFAVKDRSNSTFGKHALLAGHSKKTTWGWAY